MAEKYIPNIAYQGCLMVSPDGKLHSPLVQSLGHEKCLLLLHPDEMNEEGVKKAVQVARKRLSYNNLENNYSHNLTAHLYRELRLLGALLVCEELQKQKLLSTKLPKLDEAREMLGLKATWELVKKEHPQLDSDSCKDTELRQKYKQAYEHNQKDRSDKQKDYFYKALGLKPAQLPIEYQKACDNFTRLSPAGRNELMELLLTGRLNGIEQHPGLFLKQWNEQMAQFQQTGWHRLARLTNWMRQNASKLGLSGAGVALSGALTVIGASISGNEMLGDGAAAIALGGAGSALTATAAEALDVRVQRQLSHSNPYSKRVRKKLAAKLEETVGKLPERMQRFLEHYDPVIFIADSYQHTGPRSSTNFSGMHCGGQNIVFISSPYVSNYSTVFEECGHLIHNHILSGQQFEAFLPAYEVDMGVPERKAFFKSHSHKGIIEEHKVYDKTNKKLFGVEIIIELCHIEDQLIREKGFNSSSARKEIAKQLPEMSKLYVKYCELEDAEYRRITGGEDGHSISESKHRDRAQEQERNPPDERRSI